MKTLHSELTSLEKKLAKLSAKAAELEREKKAVLFEIQGLCPHPLTQIREWHHDYPYYSRVCIDCGLAEEEDSGFSLLGVGSSTMLGRPYDTAGCNKEIAKVSSGQSYVKTMMRSRDMGTLSLCFRFTDKCIDDVKSRIGAKTADRIMGKRARIKKEDKTYDSYSEWINQF